MGSDSDVEFADYHPSCMWGILQILDFRNHAREKHGICCRNPKPVSFERFTNELQDYLDAESVPFMVEEKLKTSTVDRVSSKAEIKPLMAKEMSAKLRLQRTHSIHHTIPDWPTPIIILQKSADTAASTMQVPSLTSLNTTNTTLNRALSDTKQQGREDSGQQFQESVDVLEILKVSKDLLLELLQDPDVKPAKNVCVRKTKKAKVRLKKSVSFTAADSLSSGFVKPSTLEHKQKEIWSFPKGDKLRTGPEVLKLVTSKDSSENSTSLNVNDGGGGGGSITQGSKFSSLVSSEGFNENGWFMRHLKVIKKKIKHALNESKKESNHRVVSVQLPTPDKEMLQILTDQRIHKHGMENSSSYHETNGYQSQSLRLTNQDKLSSTRISLKSFRRRQSLPDLDSLYPLPTGALSDAPELTLQTRPVMNYDSRSDLKQGSIDVTEVTKIEEEIGVGIAKTSEDLMDPQEGSYSCYRDPEISLTIDSCKDYIEQIAILVPETRFRDETITTTDSLVSEGTKSGSGNTCVDTSRFFSTADQPLSSTLFNELQAYLQECWTEDMTGCNHNHKILFDLINEVLLDVYETSSTYFPENFSFMQHVRPLPKGDSIVEEVRRRIDWYQMLSLKKGRSLDDIVALNLGKGDSWMNINMDSQDVALDLEDMIFDQFLYEVICSI